MCNALGDRFLKVPTKEFKGSTSAALLMVEQSRPGQGTFAVGASLADACFEEVWAAFWMRRRTASPEMWSEAGLLFHLICSPAERYAMSGIADCYRTGLRCEKLWILGWLSSAPSRRRKPRSPRSS